MKRLITLIMVGLMLFIVPLSGYAAGPNTYQSALTAVGATNYIVMSNVTSSNIKQAYIISIPDKSKFTFINGSLTNGESNNPSVRCYDSNQNIVNFKTVHGESSGLPVTTPYTGLGYWSVTNDNKLLGLSGVWKLEISTVPIYSGIGGTGTVLYTPGPEVYNYTINPGDYCRFSMPTGYSSGALPITLNVVAGNEPYIKVKNYDPAGTMNSYEATPLFTKTINTPHHIDLQLISTPNNEPLVVSSPADMVKLSTGGNPPPDGTTYSEVVLGDSPDTVILTNMTGANQKITYWRTETGQSQYTKLMPEYKSGGYWQALGTTPNIIDYKSRVVIIYKPNYRYTIYNHLGSTKVSYPVMDGFNVNTQTKGSGYQLPYDGDVVVSPDDPSSTHDGTGIVHGGGGSTIDVGPTIDTMPDDILGMLKWMSKTVLEFLATMDVAITGMFEFLGRFGTLFASISFLPPEFTIAFMALIVVSLALRVVGR